jgi:class 3 adenylate cyclase
MLITQSDRPGTATTLERRHRQEQARRLKGGLSGERTLRGERVERRLAAILAADVAGYSRLMGADEEGTLERLKAHRRLLVDPKIAEHHGRIVKTSGDGLLVEFASVVDAVRCAAEIQRGMLDREAESPEDRRITFRVGVNLGDVIVDNHDIYGHGVNIAARLEALAVPGSICISRVVFTRSMTSSPTISRISASRALRTSRGRWRSIR